MATEAEIQAAIDLWAQKKALLVSTKDQRDRTKTARDQMVASLQTLQTDVDRLALEVQAAKDALKALL
jgi:hypothetical protein